MKSWGFTIIELMITVAILAIVVSIAAPSFHSTIQSQQLQRDTKQLAMLLSQARTQAVTLRREITVFLDKQGIASETEFYWSSRDSNRLDKSASIDSLVFLPNGTLKDMASSQITLAICNPSTSKTKTIQVSRMGSTSLAGEGVCS